MRIRILVTGGTFDKEYDELTGRLFFRDTHLPEMLRRGRARLDLALETVVMIDSLEMDDRRRGQVVDRCRACAERAIVITHGTDTICETARAIAEAGIDAKTVARHMREGRNQYAPMAGVPALRDALAAKYRELYGASYDPETEITVTSGGTEAIFDSIAAVVHEGDEVIVFEPCYDSYVPAIELNGGVPVVVSLTFPEYAVPWDEVRRAMTARTRLLIFNSPHNPSGAVLRAEDIRELRALVDGTDLLIVSDEVYEHIIFDGAAHESMARYAPLAARSFVVGSFGKTYHTTGWKLGYVVAPAALTAEFRKVHQFVTFASNTPVQHA